VLKKILIVAVMIVCLVAFLLVRDWDSPDLGQALLDVAGDATGIEMTAKGFRLNLLRGLLLEDVEARSDAPGRKFEVSLDQLVFEHRLAPLLSGTVAIDRIVLERPRIELVESETPREGEVEPEVKKTEEDEGGVTPAFSGTGPSLEINEIELIDAVAVIRSEGGEGSTTRLDGLNLRLQNLSYDPKAESPIHAFAGEGELEIGEVVFDSTRITDVKGGLQVVGGRAEIKPLGFSTLPGRFTAAIGVDFNPVPFEYQVSLQANPLDFNTMVKAEPGFGPGALSLDAEGSGPDPQNLKGSGTFKLGEGEFPSIPTLRQIDEKLGRPVLVGLPYQATEVRVRIANNMLTFEPFAFEAQQAKLGLQGWIDLDGPLGLDFAVGTTREGISIEGVGANVLDALTDENGWVMIPIEVTGTQEEPSVRPDSKALLAQAAQGTKRLVQEKAVEGLKGLLRKIQN
jgi:hypothetical protein